MTFTGKPKLYTTSGSFIKLLLSTAHTLTLDQLRSRSYGYRMCNLASFTCLDADFENSHACIVGYAIVMGVFAVIFHYIGISMGWLYEFMGTLLGSAVVPIALCISVKKANRMGCVVGALSGFASGITGEHPVISAMRWVLTLCPFRLARGNLETQQRCYQCRNNRWRL